TQWLAKQLARLAEVKPQDVGYAGLKDRHALTSQWFSIWMPGRSDVNWQQICGESVELLRVERHHRKLKRGTHLGNRFKITLRQLSGDVAQIEERLNLIVRAGVPNYYGEQRFGIEAGNLDQADSLLTGKIRVKDRQRRGLYLSAARSLLFNEVVAERIERGCFDRLLEGDRFIEDGTSNLSKITEKGQLEQQLESLGLHPSAPLFGRGRSQVEAQSLALETDILSARQSWCDGLERAGLKSERRSVRLKAVNLRWQFVDADSLELSFVLPPGAFATSVLREICQYRVAENSQHPNDTGG
ncbi:MAG: tRNA pseudouridine(13) synthase TruD, partial [Motiliproteus sp.]|nr:tRNA pseudouridine(13) synthase TruD [Motiliproteus sp.]